MGRESKVVITIAVAALLGLAYYSKDHYKGWYDYLVGKADHPQIETLEETKEEELPQEEHIEEE